MPLKSKRSRSSQVPGQFLGYSLQATRAVMRLLQAEPGSFVSVEVLDDVAVSNVQGSAIVEQTKSATSANPIADRSPELWKTLANWVRAAESQRLDPATTSFELFVSRKRAGKLAHLFAAANDSQSATLALAAAKKALWGAAPKHSNRGRLASTLAPHVECVLRAKAGVARTIVQRLSLVFGSGSSHEDLVAELTSKIISADMLEAVANQMLGWVKAKLDGCIEKSEPAVIAADEFNAELVSFVRKYDRFAILNSFAPAPAEAMLNLEVQNRTYVRQLQIIGADYDVKLRAANDFLRASSDRSVWATKGLVHRSSFDEFEDVLTRAWKAKREIVAIQSQGQPADASGRRLYAECSLGQYELEGRSVPPHFTPGCYHSLADSQSVGWHPDFKAILTAHPSKKDSAA